MNDDPCKDENDWSIVLSMEVRNLCDINLAVSGILAEQRRLGLGLWTWRTSVSGWSGQEYVQLKRMLNPQLSPTWGS